MSAFLYLTIAILFGISTTMRLINTELIYSKISNNEYSKVLPKSLFIIPTGIIVGIMSITFVNYYLIYLFDIINKNNTISFPLGIILTSTIFIFLTVFNILKLKQKINIKDSFQIPKKNLIYFGIIYIILFLVPTFLMFYTYKIKDNNLLMGFSTFSDLSPHTAMTSSFGIGANVPTSYMHFPGDGIKWHFFFYFFCGILYYLGFNIDFAINIPSILVMFSALALVSLLATLLSKNKRAFLIAPILVLFRSSFNIFIVIDNCIKTNTSAINTILNNNAWYDITPYDNWGIWSINVYPNQRHLMLGIAVILILIMIFIPFVRNMLDSLKNYNWKEKIKYFLFSKDAWITKNEDKSIFVAILLVLMLPYFHGSALIAALLILAVLAVFSTNRLMHILIAILSILSSMIQSNIFSGGAENVAKFQFKYGFILGNVPLSDILNYIAIVTGLTIILALLYIIISKDKKMHIILLFSFIIPFIFAFLFQVSIEMLANHKFIQISIILLDMLVAGFLSALFKGINKKVIEMHIAILLLICLTGTGISEWITYINLNKNDVSINTKSELINWIKQNTDPEDVFLTPMWASNRFFLAGRATFFGWPYYAFSAGHNTDERGKEYTELLKGVNGNKEAFVELCRKHNIKYILDDNEFFSYTYEEGVFYNQQFIRDNFEMVAEFLTENTRIYKIY